LSGLERRRFAVIVLKGYHVLTHRPVIVYLDGGALRGTLVTLQPRVLDELQDTDGSITLRDVTRINYASSDRERTDSAQPRSRSHARVAVSKSRIVAVTDLSDAGAMTHDRSIPREQLAVLVAAGSYWFEGCLHLPVGMEITGFLNHSRPGFVALTDARLVKTPDVPQRTILINREQIACIATDN
jgi:hypothetical protein